jgi:hypothetical protein
LASALALGSGCSLHQVAPAPRTQSLTFVHVAGAPIGEQSEIGDDARISVWIQNNGADPVLLLGITPQAASDDPISLVERVPGTLTYDAEVNRMTVERPKMAEDGVLLHRGLLMPGEALPLYTSAIPLATETAEHKFRLDYLAGRWDELSQHVYVAGPSSNGATMHFRLAAEAEIDRQHPKLRRAILADGHDRLERRAAHFSVDVDAVDHRRRGVGLRDAYRIAGVQPGGAVRYCRFFKGWAFECKGGVRATTAEGQRRDLEGVTLAALRTIDRFEDQVPIAFQDLDTAEALARFCMIAEDGKIVVPREQLLELMAAVAAEGMTLSTIAPKQLSARDPRALPLLAHRGDSAVQGGAESSP